MVSSRIIKNRKGKIVKCFDCQHFPSKYVEAMFLWSTADVLVYGVHLFDA